MRYLLLCTCLLFIAAFAPAEETAPKAAAPTELPKAAIERWQKLPEGQKKRLRQLYERYRKMPPEKQGELKRKLEAFKKLTAERQKKLQELRKSLGVFTPKQRRILLRQFRSLPAQQRAEYHKVYYTICKKHPDRRKALTKAMRAELNKAKPDIRPVLKKHLKPLK